MLSEDEVQVSCKVCGNFSQRTPTNPRAVDLDRYNFSIHLDVYFVGICQLFVELLAKNVYTGKDELTVVSKQHYISTARPVHPRYSYSSCLLFVIHHINIIFHFVFHTNNTFYSLQCQNVKRFFNITKIITYWVDCLDVCQPSFLKLHHR